MEHELLESISIALNKLQQDQKVLSTKIIKLTEVCRNKFNKAEREQAEKNAAYETKFDNLIEEVEGLKKEEIKLSDDVTNLETEQRHVADKIGLIDDTLEGIKAEIEVLQKHIENDNSARNNIQDEPKEIDDRKHCRYNRRGYCRQQEGCPYYHTNEVCEAYVATGICCRQNCRLRHPKICRYGTQCYRGKRCQYLHYNSPCQRCENFSCKLYHCEFCDESFCENCTVEQAHSRNIYEETISGLPSCANIHQ